MSFFDPNAKPDLEQFKREARQKQAAYASAAQIRMAAVRNHYTEQYGCGHVKG